MLLSTLLGAGRKRERRSTMNKVQLAQWMSGTRKEVRCDVGVDVVRPMAVGGGYDARNPKTTQAVIKICDG